MKKLFDKIKGKEKNIAITAIACIAVVVLIILLINAFQPEAATQSFDADAVITTTTDNSGNTVTHYYKQYSDTFTVDMDVPTDTLKSAEIYYAGYVDYDEELLLSLFMDGVADERRVADEGTVLYYEWEDDSKDKSSAYLRIDDFWNEVCYRNRAVGDYYMFPAEGFHTHQSIKGSNNMLPLYETVYKSEDLGFMSKEEAVAYVKENLFDKLGYAVSDDVEFYSIDHQTMQSYQDSKLAEWIEQDMLPYEDYTIKDTFTEEDDFYIMCFTVEQNGIKLSGRDYFTMSTGRHVQGANIRVHLNRDGVFYYESSGIMQMGQTDAKNEKLLTVQDAIDAAYDLHSSIISPYNVTMTQIELEYASVPYNDDYNEIMLVPSWIMLLDYSADDGSHWIETLAINAVTGEEIK